MSDESFDCSTPEYKSAIISGFIQRLGNSDDKNGVNQSIVKFNSMNLGYLLKKLDSGGFYFSTDGGKNWNPVLINKIENPHE